ncbi:MAG: dTDP-4-dehydrorhamnose 3,5-epimerase family protein [Microcella pacifica]|uniref:dTDP-4-dehydrorhamnose 3,5-epimerase family protein n=1 Tax=Microcella pacifica TaxID=2591847 RepID=UPI00331464D4
MPHLGPVTPQREALGVAGAFLVRFPAIAYNDSVLYETHRDGWVGLFEEPIEHLYHVRTRRGVVRSWGRHARTTDRYVAMLGVIEVALFDARPSSDSRGALAVVQLDSDVGMGLRIPPGVWHTFRSATEHALLLNSKTPPYDPEQVDKELLPMPHESIPFQWS